jgi:hypothetical protein
MLSRLAVVGFKATVKAGLRRVGIDVRRYRPDAGDEPLPLDVDSDAARTIRAARPYTMTPDGRLFALCEAVRHVVKHDIPGDIVECGVWRGGSMMAAALTLLEQGDNTRDLWLFDTFEGMSDPSSADRRHDGALASTLLEDRESEYWCRAPVDDVQKAMALTGYPQDRIHLVAGRVEATIPSQAPERIALLRLDTDWYESTRHELEQLYPRVVPGGIVIIDDYGYWRGARRAVDEFMASQPEPLFLHRIDYSGRLIVKPAPGRR